MVFTHLLGEIYALWMLSTMKSRSQPISGALSNICPRSAYALNGTSSVYPNGRLSAEQTIGLILVVFAGLIRALCFRALGRQFTFELSLLKNHRLITTGPYQYVRQPSYTGTLCFSTGYTLFMLSPGTLLKECYIGPVSVWGRVSVINFGNTMGIVYAAFQIFHLAELSIWLVRRSFVEDMLMKREFEKEWDEWASRVRWRVIPYIL